MCFLRRLLTQREPQVVNFGFGKASFEAIKQMGYNASFSVYPCVHPSLTSCLIESLSPSVVTDLVSFLGHLTPLGALCN